MLLTFLDTYPHIFDDIILPFLHAGDIPTLLHLRLTCRLLQRFVDSTWGHLRWEAGLKWPASGSTVVFDWRGRKLTSVSPLLSLTTVLDVYVSPTNDGTPRMHREQVWRAFPAILRPQVVRVVMYDRWSTRRFVPLPPARTVIIYHPADVRHAMSSIQCLPSVNVVWKLKYASFTSNIAPVFDYTGPCKRTNVFILLSGCDPRDTHLAGLWQGMVEAVAENTRYRRETHFYLVDVGSWFTVLPDHTGETGRPDKGDLIDLAEPRMDRILDDPYEFYDMLCSLHEAYVRRSCFCREELAELAAAGCQCSNFIQRISAKEMRALIGRKAMELTFAPLDAKVYQKWGRTERRRSYL